MTRRLLDIIEKRPIVWHHPVPSQQSLRPENEALLSLIDKTTYAVMGIVFAKSFPYLLSGSYGLAEGNSTNAGTAVLAIGFILSGNHQWDRTWETSRSRNGYYQTRTVKSNNSRYVLYISTTIGIGNTNFGAGMVVRAEIMMQSLSPYLLSGSYGLAEGEGTLTNADTALLAIHFVRGGTYSRLSFRPEARPERGYYWSLTAISNRALSLWFYDTVLITDDRIDRPSGYLVRAGFHNQTEKPATRCAGFRGL